MIVPNRPAPRVLTAAHQAPAYQEALAALADGVERDFRIVEGT